MRNASQKLSLFSTSTKSLDKAAIALFPFVSRGFGIRFRMGNSPELFRDAKSVHQAVWSAKGIAIPADAATFGERYDRACSVWIVAYHGQKAIGTLTLFDHAHRLDRTRL